MSSSRFSVSLNEPAGLSYASISAGRLAVPEFEPRLGKPGFARDERFTVGGEVEVGRHLVEGDIGNFPLGGKIPKLYRSITR